MTTTLPLAAARTVLLRTVRRLNGSNVPPARRYASDAMPPVPDAPVSAMRTAAAARTTTATSAAKKKKRSSDSRFVTVGLPLLLFVAGGYIGLTQFVGGKFEARDHIIKSHSTREFDLEEEHKQMTKKLVLDDFEIKPVPKPTESSK